MELLSGSVLLRVSGLIENGSGVRREVELHFITRHVENEDVLLRTIKDLLIEEIGGKVIRCSWEDLGLFKMDRRVLADAGIRVLKRFKKDEAYGTHAR